MAKEQTDDLPYEVVTIDKRNGLYRRDGLTYKGIRLARRSARQLSKMGEQAAILPYRPIDQQQHMSAAVSW